MHVEGFYVVNILPLCTPYLLKPLQVEVSAIYGPLGGEVAKDESDRTDMTSSLRPGPSLTATAEPSGGASPAMGSGM